MVFKQNVVGNEFLPIQVGEEKEVHSIPIAYTIQAMTMTRGNWQEAKRIIRHQMMVLEKRAAMIEKEIETLRNFIEKAEKIDLETCEDPWSLSFLGKILNETLIYRLTLGEKIESVKYFSCPNQTKECDSTIIIDEKLWIDIPSPSIRGFPLLYIISKPLGFTDLKEYKDAVCQHWVKDSEFPNGLVPVSHTPGPWWAKLGKFLTDIDNERSEIRQPSEEELKEALSLFAA